MKPIKSDPVKRKTYDLTLEKKQLHARDYSADIHAKISYAVQEYISKELNWKIARYTRHQKLSLKNMLLIWFFSSLIIWYGVSTVTQVHECKA